MTDEIKQEILDFIKSKTGAASAYVFISTSEYPCQQEKDGVGCFGHFSTDCHYGMEKRYIPGILHTIYEDMVGGDKENI